MTLDTLFQDLRYTLRTLRRDPAFTTFSILIVGLGIGASATVFSVVNTLLIRPLPFRDPNRLVWIANHDVAGLSGQTTQVDHFLDLQEQSKSYIELGAYMAFYGVGDTVLTGTGDPERLSRVEVSQNFFDLLGIKPVRGRLFNSEECKWRGPRAVLMSHGLWERRFASDPGMVGRALTLNNEAVTVVGVLPPSFDFATVFAPGRHIDLYSPFPLTPETNRWGNTLAILGRLRPEATPASAQAEITILADRFTKAHPERNSFEGKIKPLADYVSGRLRLALLVLSCAVGVVMLIVCTNLSNLLLARTANRQKEIAIRTAVGAGRGRLLRQMLTEGIVLSTAGAVVGLLLAVAGTKALTHLDAMRIPLLQNVTIDNAALGFTIVMAILTGILFGLAPALQISAHALHDALKDSSRSATAGKGRSWMRSVLVVTEIAFACVLLVGAGLLMRSFVRVLDVNLGFQPERAATVRVDPDRRSYSTRTQQNVYFDEVLRRARAITGIEAAGITDALPLGKNRSWGAGAKGQTYPRGKYPLAYVRVVTDGYLRSMGVPLREGRDISERDTQESPPVILINETMARTLFPGQSALGNFIRACGERQIVGVVADVRHLALEEGAGLEMYLPIRQCGDYGSADLVVRTTLPPAQLAAAVRAALKPIAPNISGNDFRPIRQLVEAAVSPRRFIVLLLAGFAAFALILASLGIYGVISYSVSQRTQEIGIRMALGATAAHLEGGILLHTVSLAAMGMLLGGAVSLALARAISGLLYGVTATDPITFAGMVAVLTMVATAAGYFPARRAARIDPTVALRAS